MLRIVRRPALSGAHFEFSLILPCYLVASHNAAWLIIMYLHSYYNCGINITTMAAACASDIACNGRAGNRVRSSIKGEGSAV